MSEKSTWHRFDPERNVLTLELHIQPNASRSSFAGVHGDRLKVRIAAPPIDHKANTLLVDFLGKSFDVPAREVIIIRGVQSRAKTVEIVGASPGLLERIRHLNDQ